jgi:hypothetical protein
MVMNKVALVYCVLVSMAQAAYIAPWSAKVYVPAMISNLTLGIPAAACFGR